MPPHAAHQALLDQVRSVITITGLGDHDRPDWLITMTGTRSRDGAWLWKQHIKRVNVVKFAV
jgi:hypothetical protein